MTIEELKKVVRHPRVIAAFQLPHSMTHEELEEFCEEIDINGDGVIDFEEFIQFIDAKAGERVQGPVDLTHGPGRTAAQAQERAVTRKREARRERRGSHDARGPRWSLDVMRIDA